MNRMQITIGSKTTQRDYVYELILLPIQEEKAKAMRARLEQLLTTPSANRIFAAFQALKTGSLLAVSLICAFQVQSFITWCCCKSNI